MESSILDPPWNLARFIILDPLVFESIFTLRASIGGGRPPGILAMGFRIDERKGSIQNAVIVKD